jgi:hypothetical protein
LRLTLVTFVVVRIALLPPYSKLFSLAGFEIGSGMYINMEMPEDTAELMRKKACSFPGDQCPILKRATV